jgi:hypothetical protein
MATGDNGLIRQIQLEAPRERTDTLDPFNQATAEDSQEFLQFILSQIHHILDDQTSFWFNRPVRSLKELADQGDQNTISINQIFQILNQGSSAQSGPVNTRLQGTIDGVNRLFTTPGPFIHFPGRNEIKVFHNGRRLEHGVDFRVLDSGLPAGFNSVHFLRFSPTPSQSILTVEYTPADQLPQQNRYVGLRNLALAMLKNAG